MTNQLYRTDIDRGLGRTLRLYSFAKRDYHHFDGLPSVDSSGAHLRWHPLREEWIGHAASRQNRTHLPNAAECPLCPMVEGGPLTDIPVDDFDVAIFTNRFAALSEQAGLPPELGIETRTGYGICDVICYAAEHQGSFASIGKARITLLIAAISDRLTEIYQQEDILWALPFESRGREIGVTLDHPHGQIYALSHLPQAVATQARAFTKANPLKHIAAQINKRLIIAENEAGIAFCPEWARYPFELWVAPHRQMASPADMSDAERDGFAELLDKAVNALDSVFDAPMPYTFSWQIAPKGFEDSFHFHCLFQPVRRAEDKLKYLASVEQFTNFFLVDLPPETAADMLNEARKK